MPTNNLNSQNSKILSTLENKGRPFRTISNSMSESVGYEQLNSVSKALNIEIAALFHIHRIDNIRHQAG